MKDIEMTDYRPRPTRWMPIGQQWVNNGFETKPDLFEPKTCPVCGTINCGEDSATQEKIAQDQQREAESRRIDEEREAERERERIGADPESFFGPIRGW